MPSTTMIAANAQYPSITTRIAAAGAAAAGVNGRGVNTATPTAAMAVERRKTAASPMSGRRIRAAYPAAGLSRAVPVCPAPRHRPAGALAAGYPPAMNSPTSLTLAVLGATGAAGDQLLSSLHGSPLVTGPVLAFGGPRRSARVDTASWGPDSLPVHPITALGDHNPDLVFSCLPPEVAARVLPGLVARGIFVIDVGNASAGTLDVPLVNPGTMAALPERALIAGAVRTPSALGWVLASVLVPLAEAGATTVTATAIEGAIRRGKSGAEELGQQLLANFSGNEPPRRIFPDGLAFDVLVEDVPGDEWSSAERLAAEEAAELAAMPPDHIALTTYTAALFQGVVLNVHVRGVTLDAAEEALNLASAGTALRAVLKSSRLHPRGVSGKPGVAWGRLRADPGGDGVHLVAVGDNLAGAAGAVPMLVADWLVSAGVLARGSS